MITGNKVSGTAVSIPVGIALGVMLSLAVTCAMTVAASWLVLDGKIDEKLLGYLVIGILVTASAAGALLAALRIKRRWVMICLVTATVFYLLLLAVTAVLFGGNYQGIGVSGLWILVGALTSGALGLLKKGTKKKRYGNYRVC